MTKQFRINQSTQPIPAVHVRKETSEERFARLKRTADATGRRLVQVYLEDERKRQQGSQR
ncbi:hypothetical protein EPA93_04005 [Ktedonosporobacter rubrisoli]|uniref:Uncharacterized protein n=1 Tax=Ktedonosporobacter rubrisoli TaxID=2509675 RepID=A0A4V0YY71_KTERU|nr:hypothetical protein [Ktedonosporobacter rubrisoli]QBD75201.1 hypothetical protein EPA93_04005 [Ktedonosporobacter rubrisoli]